MARKPKASRVKKELALPGHVPKTLEDIERELKLQKYYALLCKLKEKPM